MLKQKRTFSDWIKDNMAILLAFIIPVVIMIGVYIIREIYPFGDQMYLRSDMYHQYAPFYEELYSKLTSGGSLTYSWNIGGGINFTALYAYYLASPINLLLGLAPEGHIIEIMSAIIIAKIGLSSAACTYYLKKHFNVKGLSVAVFGVFYGLSSYFAAFSWNIMWLDCMILLPIIILGLERLVKERKCFLYCISLGIAIFSNYYIAIMLCIFSVLYFIVLLLCDNAKKDRKYYITTFKNFALYSVIAGGMAACILIPEILALQTTVSGDMNFPDTLVNYFSILDMLSRSLINVETAIFSAHDPNLYCTVAVFVLIPLYAICSKVDKKEKACKIGLIILFFISFNTNIPNYIWHGFHFPNSLPARESFIYIFLILVMGYEAMLHLKSFTSRQFNAAVAGAVGLILIIEKLYVSDDYSFEIIYTSLAFIGLYYLVGTLYRKNYTKKSVIIYLLFVVAIAETAINTEQTAVGKTSRTYYVEDNAAIENMVAKANEDEGDNSFFRIEKVEGSRRTKNDAAWHQYRGLSTFTSTTNASLADFLGYMGTEKSTNSYSYFGATPLFSSMFSVKYVFSNYLLEDTDLCSLYASDEGASRYMYKNNYTLPLGFMVPKDLNDTWEVAGNNPFAIQNQFVEETTGISDLFKQVRVTVSGSTVTVETENAGHIFIYLTTYTEKIYTNIAQADGTYVSNNNYSGLKHRHVVDLGEVPANSIITITPDDSSLTNLQLYAYNFDTNAFKAAYEKLNAHPYDITTFEDNYICGDITADEDGLMYTSINYDKGWTAYVDGEKTDIVAFKDALVAVPVKAGTHKVEFKYTPPGLVIGICISVFFVLLLIGIIIYYRVKKNKKTLLEEQQVEEQQIEEQQVEEQQLEEQRIIESVDSIIDEEEANLESEDLE